MEIYYSRVTRIFTSEWDNYKRKPVNLHLLGRPVETENNLELILLSIIKDILNM